MKLALVSKLGLAVSLGYFAIATNPIEPPDFFSSLMYRSFDLSLSLRD
jgi:hypothetical protein